MQTYCVSCKKNTRNTNAKVIKTRNGRLQTKSVCNVCGHKKSRLVSKKERSGLLSSLGIRKPLNRIPALNILF